MMVVTDVGTILPLNQAGIPGMSQELNSMPVRPVEEPASLQAEISPPHARGLLSGWTQLMIVIGFLVSLIFGIGGLWNGWLTLALDQQVANCKLCLDSSMCRSLLAHNQPRQQGLDMVVNSWATTLNGV
jgi:hypothetical protein